MWEKSELLLLLITANGVPILLDKLLGSRFSLPLDGGLVLGDGRRLIGKSGTVRGVVGAVTVTSVLTFLLWHDPRVGALIGLVSMIGDAISSFVKRRLGLAPGDKATGLDQVPESLLPLLAVAERYSLGWEDITVLVSAFTLFDMTVSGMLYRLHIRRRPH